MKTERRRETGEYELNPEVIEAFTSRFFPRRDIHAIQTKTGRYVLRKAAVTPALIRRHLYGKVTLGTYALSSDSQSGWAVIDADDDRQWQRLLRFVKETRLPVYMETSRRGGHLWLFFEDRVSGEVARRFTKAILKPYGVEGIEIFPKQDERGAGPGSLIRLPLGIHRKVGKRFGFVTVDGSPLAPSIREQVAVLADAAGVPASIVHRYAAEFNEERKHKPRLQSPFPTQPVDGEKPLSERIKATISVFDFVSRYVALDKRTGHGFCPFHYDENPSFGVNAKGNYWACFAGCGGGSIIDFWGLYRERVLGQSGGFIETIKDLAEILNL